MRNDIEKLRGAIGRYVGEVALEIQFFGVETKGTLSGALIDFVDGTRFALGCSGDGSIFIANSCDDKGNAPGVVTLRRALVGLCGELGNVSSLSRALRLMIGGRELLIANVDDHLAIAVDSKAPSQEMLTR